MRVYHAKRCVQGRLSMLTSARAPEILWPTGPLEVSTICLHPKIPYETRTGSGTEATGQRPCQKTPRALKCALKYKILRPTANRMVRSSPHTRANSKGYVVNR